MEKFSSVHVVLKRLTEIVNKIYKIWHITCEKFWNNPRENFGIIGIVMGRRALAIKSKLESSLESGTAIEAIT